MPCVFGGRILSPLAEAVRHGNNLGGARQLVHKQIAAVTSSDDTHTNAVVSPFDSGDRRKGGEKRTSVHATFHTMTTRLALRSGQKCRHVPHKLCAREAQAIITGIAEHIDSNVAVETGERLRGDGLRREIERQQPSPCGAVPLASTFRLAALISSAEMFHRLKVLRLAIPSFASRMRNIRLLARHFAVVYAGQNGRAGMRLTRAALQKLQSYSGPAMSGNWNR